MTKRPEPYLAAVLAALAVSFTAGALITLPIHGAKVLAVARVLAWSG